MPEYRNHIDTPMVVLNKKDIEALAKLLAADIGTDSLSSKYSTSIGETSYCETSLEKLLQHDLPNRLDSLEITIHNWNEKAGINRTASITLHPRFGYYQVHSNDEVWFLGKSAQIRAFFNKRKPWYSAPAAGYAGITGGMTTGMFLSAVYLFNSGHIYFAALSALVVIGCGLIYKSVSDARFLPQSKLILKETPTRISNEFLMLVFTAIGALAAVGQIVVQKMTSSASPANSSMQTVVPSEKQGEPPPSHSLDRPVAR